MAAKRIATSAINWTAFSKLVPANQNEFYRAFKAHAESFVSKVHVYPEVMPKIDWSFYRSRISLPGLVDNFEKSYDSMKVEYPTDKSNMKAAIDTEEKEAAVQTKQYVMDVRTQIDDAKLFLAKMDSLPPVEEMTQEMFVEYFPDQALDPWEKPTIWPHNRSEQPGNDPNEMR